MQDWRSKADASMAELRRHYDSGAYRSLVEFVSASYEAEKEDLVIASPEEVLGRVIRLRSLREFRDALVIEPV